MALWAALAAVTVGGLAMGANPDRPVNRALLPASLHVAAWLMCLHFALVTAASFEWMRLASALGGAFPAQLWWLKEAVVRPESQWRERLWRIRGWLFFAVVVAVLSATNFVVPLGSTPRQPVYGPGYYVYVVSGFAAYLVFGVRALWQMRALEGVKRLELQILLLGASAASGVAYILMGLGGFLNEPTLLQLMPVAVLVIFAGTAWAIVSARVLDAHHILSLGFEKTTLLAAVALFVWGVQQLAAQFVPDLVAFVAALAVGLWFAAQVGPWLQDVFQRKARAENVRRAAYAAARKELRPDAIEEAFVDVLKRWAKCERAVVLMGSQGRLTGDTLEFDVELPAMKTLHSLRWVTPERLAREKLTPDRAALRDLLAAHGFGAMVANTGPSLAFAVAVGTPYSRRPYTFPEVNQLLELSGIFENTLSRAHYLMKAQHAEQLATVGLLGASIAHEIRNPLVSIKTFVQLLPKHYHDPGFRDKFFRLIGDEVSRIDRLTEQLLDLASPRVFAAQRVEIHPLLLSCLDLIAAKAEDKGVRLISDFQANPGYVHTDPTAVKQVMLNLGFNAIQALEQTAGERWIRFSTKQVPDGVEVGVTDTGPGIAPDVWSRLFQPFQSTKSSGFGLGLAICKDILSSLHASITADPPVAGQGATFRIVLPCPPPTS